MSSYAICGFMGWFSNMASIQYLSSNRSFFIAFDQYFLIFTPFDICAAPKLRIHERPEFNGRVERCS